MPRFVRCALTLSMCVAGSSLYGQSALTELYGEGVHRYFAGDLLEAEQHLTRAIDGELADPRAYYYRGLVREALGGEGEDDFKTGATLEAEGQRSFDIGLALSRIQGFTRLQIEKARLDARLIAQEKGLSTQRPRLEPNAAAPTPLPQVDPLIVPPVVESDPFTAPPETTVVPPVVDPVQPTTPEIDAESDPFTDDPALQPTTPEPTVDDAADPFSTDGGTPPATDDPFSTPSVEIEPAEADPFSEPAAGDEPPLDDPFSEPATEAPATEAPAAGDEPALDDPFAE